MRRARFVLALALSALAAPAFALPSVPHLPDGAVPRDVCGIQIPPARYRSAKPIVKAIDGPHFLGAAAVAAACRGAGTDRALGCTTFVGLRDAKGFVPIGARVVIARRPPFATNAACTAAVFRASLLRHERAHLAGWPQNHPGR